MTNFATAAHPSDLRHSSFDIPHSPTAAQDVHGEIFDVVDLEDRVKGQLSRHEVHRQKLLHRAVHIFVLQRTRRPSSSNAVPAGRTRIP